MFRCHKTAGVRIIREKKNLDFEIHTLHRLLLYLLHHKLPIMKLEEKINK